MARTPKITNQQILEAAREIFLQQGFGASTIEIAQQAGISEASIFKRFSTKEELFFAAMGIPEKPLWVKELEILSGQGDLKQNLIKVCLEILEFYREIMPRLMMLRSRGQALPELGNRLESKCLRDAKVLTTFLEQEREKGRLSLGDPNTIALILLGSVMNYVLLEERNPQASITTDAPIFIQNFVEILWQGIAPTQD